MKVEVRTRNVTSSEQLLSHVSRRLSFALRRFAREIDSAVVRLSDMNGPRGGEDKKCHLVIRGPRIRTISIEERSSDVGAGVDLLVDRAARTVARSLERRRDFPAVRIGSSRGVSHLRPQR